MFILVFLIVIVLLIAIPVYIGINNNKKYKEQLKQNSALAIESKAIHLSGLFVNLEGGVVIVRLF